MAPKTKAPRVVKYDFCGPIGTAAISLGLPTLIYSLIFFCNDISGCPAPSLLSPKTLTLEKLKQEVGWPEDGIWGLCSVEVALYVLAYYFLSLVLHAVLPATEVEGTVLQNGSRLKYRFNSFSSNLLILSVCLAGTVAQGAEFPVWTFIDTNFLQIFTMNLIISFVLAVYSYVGSFSVKPGNKELRELAKGGHTGNIIYDWFIGRELNPRVTLPLFGEIDIKTWCEMRPGLLGWILFNFTWMAKQYRTYGFVSDSMILTCSIQLLYVLDGWYLETGILTMMDITTDGFGFMLSFGDVAWLPFLYCTQTRYLSVYPITLGPYGIASILAILATGFYIFRASNTQKNKFRHNPQDPSVSHLKYITTKRGTKLLVSGWWGAARHINYFGDWVQGWPYCLPTGIAGYTILAAGAALPASATGETPFVMADGRQVIQGDAKVWGMVFTYFYVIYFGVLLAHRETRDDEMCREKYGDDWTKYKKLVPYKFIPYVF